MHVKVVARWTPSVSPNVAFTELVWALDGVENAPVSLSPEIGTAESPFGDVDGKKVGVKVTVVGTNGLRSTVEAAERVVPVQEVAPEPVKDLVLDVVPVESA